MKINFKENLLKDLKKYKNEIFANRYAKYFQTHKGGYGEGDFFWGLKVPQQRITARKYWKDINLKDVEKLLQHRIHEVRLTALMILIEKYKKADDAKSVIVKIYLRNSECINNWDLVDLSAPYIPGHYWHDNSLKDFWEYAESGSLWKERIAMISTLYFIRQGRFVETLALSKLFLAHNHDLIHKASGWMLREVGKRDTRTLISFLDKYSNVMPRTMLRYSIEKLSQEKREYYMEKDI
ncbi:DNA alkylation repair protein [Endomicrobiia bacterium]|uniref:DNA alkylation repair enzyme n=1 Tax=Endomicrobium trichonymphae TaxID=1408204 RepID=B1GZK2_ENDTX|nr:DNA alkylation repair protein [Candidatus Endomicrobium trichonymphae]BAG13684.1 putative DNA alkylation repair enzyme [Candidatus Endomicrobium trichonymphae]GHT09300.1 DNA alkylation repair protein [Endomicrobiia bacterium]GMO55073.1 MAG: DNA alkylation repair protein [Candidatus Endomicrobium trichonymphae]